LTADVGKVYPENESHFIFDNACTERNRDCSTLFDFKGTIELAFCPFRSRNRTFTPVFRRVFSDITLLGLCFLLMNRDEEIAPTGAPNIPNLI
jgi:hypothetical protein